MTKFRIIFFLTALFAALQCAVFAQDGCLDICPDQAPILSVSGEDDSAINAVVCINQLDGTNFVLQNGNNLSNLPEAVYSCYTVAVSNNNGFDISSLTYSVDNLQAELDMALMGTDDCASVGAAKAFDINSEYCGLTCMLNVCPCDGSSNQIEFVYTPSDDDGTEQFLLVDGDGNIVALSSTTTIDATALASGAYSIYALIYDPNVSSNLPDILSSGGTLAAVEAELAASACGSLSDPINATVNSNCNCEEPPICVTDVCPCTGEENNIILNTTGYTGGDNEQWYVVISNGVVVDAMPATSSGSVLFAGLPDGSHEVYAVNYNPTTSANVGDAISIGSSWPDVVTGITDGTLCAAFVGPQNISINSGLCNCPSGECEASAGEVGTVTTAYCNDDDVDLTLSVSGNQTSGEYGTLLVITSDNGATADIYDIVGVAEAVAIGSGMYNLSAESAGYYNILGLEPGDYCVHSVNYLLSDFDPATELQILGSGSGFISSLDALNALTPNPVCADVTTTACQAFSIYEEISYAVAADCNPDDLENFSISISNIAGGSGSDLVVGASDGSIADNGDGTYTVSGIPNGTLVTISVSDNVCSSTQEITGNCFDVDCPVEVTADASNQAACDGEAIALSINTVVGASGIATFDYTLSWSSSDATVDVSDAANVVLNNSDCLAKEVVFTATLVCLDGATTISSDINVTVYPASIDAYISFTGEGTCDPRIAIDANCSDVILSSTRTPGAIDPDQSGNASWDVSYAYQGNNIPLPGACNLNLTVEAAFTCAPVCPTPVPSIFGDLDVCSGSSFDLPVLIGIITTENATGNLYAEYAWSTSDGSFSSDDGGVNSVTLENTDCAPRVITFNYEITCALDGSAVRSGSFDVAVYATDISSFVTLDESDGCLITLTPNEGCEAYVTGDAFAAPEGTDGTVSLTSTYIGSDCAASYSVEAAYDCAAPILCDAGTISGGSVTFVCEGQNAIVRTTDAIGIISYVLHNGDNTSIGEVFASSFTGVFTNDGSLPLNVELCISAVAGSSQLPNGMPDPDGECYDISNCARVVFISPIEIDAVESCDETTGLVTLSVTISGGSPEYLPAVHSYNITGSIVATGSAGEVFEIGPLSPGDEYSIFIDDDGKGCGESYVNVVGDCIMGATCDGGSIEAGSNFVCDGEFSIFRATGTEGLITYVLHNGDDDNIGTVYATSATGVFTNDGTLPLNVEVCATAVAGITLGADGIPDPNGECYDLSNCAKVVFLSPIVVDFTQTCNAATGIVEVDYTISGGAPEFLPGVHFYNITGSNGHTNSSAESGSMDNYGDVSPNMNYSLSVIDDGKGCEGQYDFTAIPCEEEMGMPAISIVKTANSDGITTPAIPGQVIFYSFEVCNIGNTALNNVIVTDVLVQVTGGPISLAIDACDANTFTASYTITAADIAAGGVFNTATVSGTSPDDIKVTDSDDENVPLEPAGCSNDAGTMPSDVMNICFGGYANVTTTGASVDGGSSLTYVLHNGDGSNIDEVLDFNATGLFLNDGSYPNNTELYICAVAAPANGGVPDFDAECIDISNCTPVVFLEQMIIDIEVQCYGDGRYDLIFTINGGMPSAYPSSQYTVTGDYNGLVLANNPTVVGPFDAATLYAIYATDENNCGASAISQSIICEKLPIDLISYTGEVQAQGNMLKWVTASEIDNAYFTLEHSTDGSSFTAITTIDGAGTVSDSQSYNFLHRDAPAGISYYKLWQTDLNGTKNYVGIVGLTRGEVSLNITNILPIPVLEFMELSYTSISESQAQLQIFDALGRNMIDVSILSNTGINNRTIDVASFTPGIYFLTISQGDDSVTEKFIKE